MLQPRVFKELRKPDGYPEKLETLGDHIKAKRLENGLTQKQLAESLGITNRTILSWEKDRFWPNVQTYKLLVDFLGIDPAMDQNYTSTFGERLTKSRKKRGLSQRQAAARIGIDPCTLSKYERGDQHPTDRLLVQISRFLSGER